MTSGLTYPRHMPRFLGSSATYLSIKFGMEFLCSRAANLAAYATTAESRPVARFDIFSSLGLTALAANFCGTDLLHMSVLGILLAAYLAAQLACGLALFRRHTKKTLTEFV